MQQSFERQIHGGRIKQTCQQYGGQPQDWLDVSTGIAPWPYPLSTVPEQVWQRLPEEEDGLIDTASQYYQVQPTHCLAVAGSQWAIETIPTLYPKPLRVLMFAHGYAEHPRAWQLAGHEVVFCEDWHHLLSLAPTCDAAVIIQPHNPLGMICSQDTLNTLKSSLRQGIVILDEAFADTQDYPTLSLSPDTWRLRSVGKFFGLAGIRLGFVLATETQISQLADRQSPWAVNHLARWAGQQALADTAWQLRQQQSLREQAEHLRIVCHRYGFAVMAETHFFVTIRSPAHHAIWTSAAQSHILLRHFPDTQAIRIGLPRGMGDWFRLEKWMQQCPH